MEVKVETVETLMEAPINKGQERINGPFSIYEKHLTQIDSFVSHRNSEYSAELRLHKEMISLLVSNKTLFSPGYLSQKIRSVLKKEYLIWKEL